MSGDNPTDFLTAWRRPATLRRGAKVSAIVGSVLLLINHGPRLFEGDYPAYWQIILTYMVPFLVSTISGAMAEVHHTSKRHDD